MITLKVFVCEWPIVISHRALFCLVCFVVISLVMDLHLFLVWLVSESTSCVTHRLVG